MPAMTFAELGPEMGTLILAQESLFLFPKPPPYDLPARMTS